MCQLVKEEKVRGVVSLTNDYEHEGLCPSEEVGGHFISLFSYLFEKRVPLKMKQGGLALAKAGSCFP
jgi:hypothetical protein